MSTTPKYSRHNPEQRREEILDAANALFAERGYDEVSVEDIAYAAGVTRGLVHHYFGGRKEVYIALLERLGTMREQQLPAPVGRSARARLADSVSRWLDWTEQNRMIWLGTLGVGEDIADPDVRAVVLDLVRRAVALVAARHADLAADDSPRLRYALECWTGLNRAATRRWLQSQATREQTHELIASTLSNTSYAPSAPHPSQTGAHPLKRQRSRPMPGSRHAASRLTASHHRFRLGCTSPGPSREDCCIPWQPSSAEERSLLDGQPEARWRRAVELEQAGQSIRGRPLRVWMAATPHCWHT